MAMLGALLPLLLGGSGAAATAAGVGATVAGATAAGGSLLGTLGTIGSVLTAGGTIYGGMVANQNAQAQAGALKKKGDDAFAVAQRKEISDAKNAAMVQSRQRALNAAGGNGSTDTTTSIGGVMARTQQQGEYNAMMDMYNGAVDRSDMYDAAKSASASGTNAVIGSVISAGSGLYKDAANRSRQNNLIDAYTS